MDLSEDIKERSFEASTIADSHIEDDDVMNNERNSNGNKKRSHSEAQLDTTGGNNTHHSSKNLILNVTLNSNLGGRGNKLSRKQKKALKNEKKENFNGVPICGFWDKSLLQLALVASFNISRKSLDRMSKEASDFGYTRMSETLSQIIQVTVMAKRKTITNADVMYVLDGENIEKLPPLPEGLSCMPNLHAHYNAIQFSGVETRRSEKYDALKEDNFDDDLYAFTKHIVNKTEAEGNEVVVHKDNPDKPLRFQRSASETLRAYISMQLIWFYYNKCNELYSDSRSLSKPTTVL